MKENIKKLLSSRVTYKNAKMENKKEYFQLASSWADDYYTTVVSSRARYQIAFLVAMGLCSLLTIGMITLSKIHEYIPLVIHHYESGEVSVTPMKQQGAPENQAEVESDLVRYVISRESYDPASFDSEYQLVMLLSNSYVAKNYRAQQNSDDDQSLVHQLSNKIIRAVRVESVNFLDNEELDEAETKKRNHKNLAEINFVIIDKSISSGKEVKTPYVAIISWGYRGIPNDPEARWMNWNGFMVTSYQRNQRIAA